MILCVQEGAFSCEIASPDEQIPVRWHLTHRVTNGIMRTPHGSSTSPAHAALGSTSMTEAIRQIYWNVGEGFAPLALYLTAIAALAVMTWGILRDIGRWSRGKPDMRINQ